MRISGITIPDEKQIAYGLTAVFGIGLSRAKAILLELEIDPTIKPTTLSTDQENSIREKVESFRIEGDLKRDISSNIKLHVTLRDFLLADNGPKLTLVLSRALRRLWEVDVVSSKRLKILLM